MSLKLWNEASRKKAVIIYILLFPKISIHPFHVAHKTPCSPPKLCINIVSNFSRVLQYCPEKKLKTTLVQYIYIYILGGLGGGGVNKVLHGQ